MIDAKRHRPVFDPDAFNMAYPHGVYVIGAGATGSKVVKSLAKHGVQNIHVYDFDQVESHNIANQEYGNSDVGSLKIDALKQLVESQTGTLLHVHNEFVDGSQPMGAVTFVLTDKMKSRRQIWERAIRMKPRTKLLIETRMGKDSGRVYVINPVKLPQIKGYEATLYDDDKAEESTCGTSISVGATAGLTAELAVWQLFRWFAVQTGKLGVDELDHEILFFMNPPSIMPRRFDS